MVFIYVLSLQDNKYYIGKTNTPYKRITSHFSNDGSAWTKKYKPIDIHKIIPDCDDFDETKYTLEYMKKHGINNVRGGLYYNTILSPNDIQNINKQLNCDMDKCFKCGNYGHFAKECQLLNNDTQSNNTQSNNTQPNDTQPNDNVIIEYAKTDKSKCRICNLIINQNDLRIGCKSNSKNYGEILLWHHIICFLNKNYTIDLDEIIEFAKTNKSKCRICNTIINQNDLRVGCKTNSKYGEITVWRHIECICLLNNITFNL